MTNLPRITDLSLEALRHGAAVAGAKPFHGDQAWEWVMARGVRNPEEMSNLPAGFRRYLRETSDTAAPTVEWFDDAASTTDKLYLGVAGGDGVEAVLINEGDRSTACLSSQVGCPVACRFCASGMLGLRRNLTAGEILDQFIEVRRRSEAQGRRLSNIVMMGMGEPLLNVTAVLESLKVINDPKGGAIGARHITISTVGLSKGIDRLVEEPRQYTLAFSLHAPDDATRQELIPFPGALSVAELMDAARRYLAQKGREVTFEYVLLDSVNASEAHAKRLSHLLRGVRGTVNLIPYNENPGLPFRRPSPAAVDTFAEVLRRGGARVTVRKRKGHRVLAACGQLRLRKSTESS